LKTLLISVFAVPVWQVAGAADYAVVVSEGTAGEAGWGKVVAALAEKHGATVMKWKGSVDEVLAGLSVEHPRFTCFVATPAEAGRDFVNGVHRMTRKLDKDLWVDTRWGILTGLTAEDAMRSVTEREGLVIRKVGSGTELAMDRIESGTWYCELRQGHMVSKASGGEAAEGKAPGDTTAALVGLKPVTREPWAQDEAVYNKKFETRQTGTPERYVDKTARSLLHKDRQQAYLNRYGDKYDGAVGMAGEFGDRE
jgi:hypothetical protein